MNSLWKEIAGRVGFGPKRKPHVRIDSKELLEPNEVGKWRPLIQLAGTEEVGVASARVSAPGPSSRMSLDKIRSGVRTKTHLKVPTLTLEALSGAAEERLESIAVLLGGKLGDSCLLNLVSEEMTPAQGVLFTKMIEGYVTYGDNAADIAGMLLPACATCSAPIGRIKADVQGIHLVRDAGGHPADHNVSPAIFFNG